MSLEEKRAELERYIANTRRTQKRLAVGLAIGVVVSIALALWRAPVGGAGIGICALVALSGFWITAGHIVDFRNRINDLGKPKTLKMVGGGKRF
jgi:hypothetical protein